MPIPSSTYRIVLDPDGSIVLSLAVTYVDATGATGTQTWLVTINADTFARLSIPGVSTSRTAACARLVALVTDNYDASFNPYVTQIAFTGGSGPRTVTRSVTSITTWNVA
jgi:hypothetical protein